MKLVQINVTYGKGSTGRICMTISELLTERGVENYVLYSAGASSLSNGTCYMTPGYTKLQAIKSKILGNYGFNSKRATKKLIKKIDELQPDIVHLHNLHGHNCSLEMLFNYFKQKSIRLIWTFHDCWCFTGYCTYYDIANCYRWRETGCKNCPQKAEYSWFFDKSEYLYKKKKQLFTGLNLTIVTPSQWLAEQVKQSFFKDYNVTVINNGIDLSVFKPQKNNFREKYNCCDKKLLLGVAFDWGKRKGLDIFIELSKRLNDNYRIVLVGTNNQIDKILPEGIISIHRTLDLNEMVDIYSAADLFINPTREEVLGLTNLEALACGTPVITFNTGGSPECIDDTCGVVIEKDDIDTLIKTIEEVTDNTFSEESCRNRAMLFDQEEKYKQYMELYGV